MKFTRLLSLAFMSAVAIGSACSSSGDGGAGGSGGDSGEGGSGGEDGEGGNGGSGGQGGKATGGSGGGAGKGGSGGGGSGGAAGGVSGGTGGGAAGNSGGMGGAMTASVCPAGMQWPAPDIAGKTPMVIKETGFEGVEGPVWVAAQKAFFFSDLQRSSNMNWGMDASSKIWKYTPADSKFEVFIAASGSNGLALTPDGKILAATHSNGGLTVFDPATKAKSILLDKVNDMRLGSPNDLAVRSDGNIYFSDPEWQKPGNVAGQGQKVYRVDPAKNVTTVSSSISRPNGVTLSPDGNTLYVSDDAKNVWKFTVAANGLTTAAGKLAMTMGNYPDGMTADCAGNVYVATQMGVEVFKPNGDRIGTIGGGGALNVAFGGEDGKTLFITGPTDRKVSVLPMNLPGLPY